MTSVERSETLEISVLYNHHHGWLLGVLQRRVGCFATAEDLTQDVFLRLLGKSRIPPLQEPRAYLTQVANGLVVDRHRRIQVERAWRETLASQPESFHPAPEVELSLIDALTRIDALLEQMPSRARRIFLMSRLDGFAYADIARHLNVSLSTVQKDMTKALKYCYQVMMG